MNPRTLLRSLAFSLSGIAAACVTTPQAPENAGAPASAFGFATFAEAKAILAARDDYVRATSPIERSARLRTAETVDEDRFIQFMQTQALEWTDEERSQLAPLVTQLDRFIAAIKSNRPEKILIVQAGRALEESSPHTRANAILLPKGLVHTSAPQLSYVMAHETFHVLSRADRELREKLYGIIGFRRCERIDIPRSVASLRITNPDAVENHYTISVRHRGQPVDALPFLRFRSDKIDTRLSFLQQSQVAWLLVDREGANCRVRDGAEEQAGVAPRVLEGLYEQIGRNSHYLIHPEEILADNFAILFSSTVRGVDADVPSPEILKRMRAILYQ